MKMLYEYIPYAVAICLDKTNHVNNVENGVNAIVAEIDGSAGDQYHYNSTMPGLAPINWDTVEVDDLRYQEMRLNRALTTEHTSKITGLCVKKDFDGAVAIAKAAYDAYKD